ncbi:hypothetical protein Q8F55_000918 [Vanrija albida]|uniref:Calcineurin-like phosphoesterase domain-containing protein n=1 Tax=Vanrija albida TaxID=181172 RepID=A0ABR3QEP1_9TREE
MALTPALALVLTLPLLAGAAPGPGAARHALDADGDAAAWRSPPVLPVPTRPLPWGDVNFLATSDTHGWLRGHQHNTWPEPNYSGDFGTFASFAEHMRAQADERGVDLLLVDAGDHHDGSGLVSTSPASAVAADNIFAQLTYDVLAIGNHELYKYESALDVYEHNQKGRWAGRYLTSNVNITVEERGRAVSVPVAERFAKFETRQGRRVTAFGVLFDFKAHDRNLTVQAPTKLAREAWFLDAIAEAPDFFLLVGHMPGRGLTSEWSPLFDAIRALHPTVPVFVFGGHTHVRDCVQYDDRSIALVPGRYLETIGFVSSSLPGAEDDGGALDMNRRYLDANDVTYQYHTGTDEDTFHTPVGRNISSALAQLAQELQIDIPFGTVPHDYFLARHPYGHPRSVLTLIAEKILPEVLEDQKRRGPRIIIGNAGTLRFDVFKGPFDRNDELTVSPFTSAFLYTRLPAFLATEVFAEMNRAGASKLLPTTAREDVEARATRIYNDWLADQWDEHVAATLLGADDDALAFGSPDKKPHTLGYVTRDACKGRGDDIPHIPVPFSRDQVDFIMSPPPDAPDDEVVDVVVMDFAMDDFLTAVHTVDPTSKLTLDDFEPYAEGTLVNAVFGKYASREWE